MGYKTFVSLQASKPTQMSCSLLRAISAKQWSDDFLDLHIFVSEFPSLRFPQNSDSIHFERNKLKNKLEDFTSIRKKYSRFLRPRNFLLTCSNSLTSHERTKRLICLSRKTLNQVAIAFLLFLSYSRVYQSGE